ncbi:MAG: c-type cytochrome [Polyangiaceae bacterium]|nr:c-type cytochrome [Polyangiaceae bacterium]
MTVKRVLVSLALVIALFAVGIAGVVMNFALKWPPTFPDIPTPDIHASTDPKIIAQGEYLYNAVAHCPACHTPSEEYQASKPGTVPPPKGGHEWHMGPLATVRSANITADKDTGIGKWSDGEIARAVKYGIRPDHTAALFMFAVGAMADQDLTALVSYLRTVPAVKNQIPDSEIGALGKVLFQSVMGFFAGPKDYPTPAYVAAGEVSIARGRYLAEGPGMCAGCHSDPLYADGKLQYDGPVLSGRKNQPWPDETDPEFEFVGPNLTPAKSGAITGWKLEQFVKRFRTEGRRFKGSVMPWESFANLTDSDLESIWLYLSSLPPTEKKVGPQRRAKGSQPQ